MLIGSVGLVVGLFPLLWLHLFSHDAEVLRQGAIYLRIVAPAYGALGFGFVIAFAAMGAGHVLWTFIASFARILIAAGGGWLAVTYFGAGMAGLAAMVTASLIAYAAICSVVMLSNSVWRVKTEGLGVRRRGHRFRRRLDIHPRHAPHVAVGILETAPIHEVEILHRRWIEIAAGRLRLADHVVDRLSAVGEQTEQRRLVVLGSAISLR